METNTVCLNVNVILTDELEKGLLVRQLSEFITHFRPTPNVKLKKLKKFDVRLS